MRRSSNLLLVILLGAAVALAPALALAAAKAGGGSRGARTYQAPAPTRTAPKAKPIERSVTQPSQQAPQARPAPAAAPAAQPGFLQRNPFLGGIMGGLLGAGIGSLLFGGGLGLGGLGMAGGIGLLLQLALLGVVAWLVIGFIRRRAMPTYAQSSSAAGPMARMPIDIAPSSGGTSGGGAISAATDEIGIAPTDYDAFERLLVDIQAAWSHGDVAALRRLVTPEMLSYFSEALAANVSQGNENHVEDVRLEQGDLAEAWREDANDFATVAMRWSSLDYTVRADNGAVVEGDCAARGETTEVWTFMRSAGGRWLLSAIQQVENR